MIKSIAALALVAFGALTVACGEDTSQPDVAEAYASDLTDGTSTDTAATQPAAEEAPAPTPAQADKADESKTRRTELHSSDRIESKPLKGE
jgi:hypothetical protein